MVKSCAVCGEKVQIAARGGLHFKDKSGICSSCAKDIKLRMDACGKRIKGAFYIPSAEAYLAKADDIEAGRETRDSHCVVCGKTIKGTFVGERFYDGSVTCTTCYCKSQLYSDTTESDSSEGAYTHQTSANSSCNQKASPLFERKKEDKTKIEKARNPEKKPSRQVENYLFFDKEKRLVIFNPFLGNVQYAYSDILSFELLEDSSIISKGGIGGAVIGGAVFNAPGAIIGAILGKKTNGYCNSLKIKILFKGDNPATEYCDFLSWKTKRGSMKYKFACSQAQELLSALQLAVDIVSEDKTKQQSSEQVIFVADEVKKIKEFLEQGVITQEEFNKLKKRLIE